MLFDTCVSFPFIIMGFLPGLMLMTALLFKNSMDKDGRTQIVAAEIHHRIDAGRGGR